MQFNFVSPSLQVLFSLFYILGADVILRLKIEECSRFNLQINTTQSPLLVTTFTQYITEVSYINIFFLIYINYNCLFLGFRFFLNFLISAGGNGQPQLH